MSISLYSPDMSLGVPLIDESHRTLMHKLTQLYTALDDDFPVQYAALVARVESDFREEESLMEKIDFPCIRLHREEHAKLLGGLHHAAAAVMKGDVDLGRHVIALLPQWFSLHISTLDSTLAFALQFRCPDRLG